MAPKNKIVIVTDCKDIAYNEIRGVIISELEKIDATARVDVEPPVFAKEFSLINGAFLVRLIAECYAPENTIILGILNPLKTNRGDRARIIGETLNGVKFVGENTGLFSWLINDLGIKEIFESSRAGIDGAEFISFGGKYVHAPIAAQIAAGTPLSKIGAYFDKSRITNLDIKPGTVLHIDNFGVLKIYGQLYDTSDGQEVDLLLNSRKVHDALYTNSMKNLPDGTWALYKGSSLNNLPEIGIVRNTNTAKIIGAEIGDLITWEPKLV
ncbi:hypothetical protein A2685_02050 [Candidatus Woesebacteria bacterium RIFCSPHIGHO2_01_FULL_37_10]|uniref:S-adenosyl-l-methionine hydroxide adenosyltransferase N-terminal domain-containing protein n=1 Tax=Candidatus Woesebacteria bacterium RIFCSPHIGHO2_01_FULL_37_10 TaxID=1802489 RepID=A0A1F7XUY3_9BACT|nr:MAG: hypothetical protein A2685_02050 [Candidatus Woesebacteria bacterium RIFCSPHIGHO2_01_FULL_37_10]